jgi:hypothetical protein
LSLSFEISPTSLSFNSIMVEFLTFGRDSLPCFILQATCVSTLGFMHQNLSYQMEVFLMKGSQ